VGVGAGAWAGAGGRMGWGAPGCADAWGLGAVSLWLPSGCLIVAQVMGGGGPPGQNIFLRKEFDGSFPAG